MGLKAVFFDLDDTLYTSFQAGDAYAYEKAGGVGHQHVWRQKAKGSRTHSASTASVWHGSSLPCRLRMTVCCLHRVHSSAWPERVAIRARHSACTGMRCSLR